MQIMKQRDARSLIRLLLILCVNGGLLVSSLVTIVGTHEAQRSDPVLQYKAAPMVTLENIAWLLPLAIGIVAEVLMWRVAKYVNVGYYSVVCLWMFLGTALAQFHIGYFADTEHWAAGTLLFGLPSGCFAVLLWWL